MEALGPRGLAVVVDLIDAIVLGSGGIHIVVTDRSQAVRAEIESRCPTGWVIEPLFSPERDSLSTVAYEPSRNNDVLLLGIVEPQEPREQSSMRALNDDREWLLRRRTCAVVIVAGKDARAADAAYLELQTHAPDFWSVRNRVHRVVGVDGDRAMKEELLDLLTPKFDGDRAAAFRWLDRRSVGEDWVTNRLWREGARREAWLALAAAAARSESSMTMPDEPRSWSSTEESSRSAPLPSTPIGDAIAPDRWPTPVWPSGQLDALQQSLMKALGAALDRDGIAELRILPEDEASEALTTAALTLGLVRASQYRVVLHLDARTGLEDAVARCLREAGETTVPSGVIDAARRLQGALSGAAALLLISDAKPIELDFLRISAIGRAIIATVRGEPFTTFCVVASPAHDDRAKWARTELSAWAGGASIQWLRAETAPLDLRIALGRARNVVALVDSSWKNMSPEAWRTLETASHRVAAFELTPPMLYGAVSMIPWYGELGPGGSTDRDHLRHVAHALAGDAVDAEGLVVGLQDVIEGGLRAAQEAIEADRGLVQQRPEVFLPDLARALNNLGIHLDSLGRGEEALRVTQEAVEIYRGLAQQQSDPFLHDLAGALSNLGIYLTILGRQEEALRAMQEVVDIRRGLTKQ